MNAPNRASMADDPPIDTRTSLHERAFDVFAAASTTSASVRRAW